MDDKYIITSERLGLRKWLSEDIKPFALMNSDPEVMRYFPKTLFRQESEGFIERIHKHFKDHGYGLYAVNEITSRTFIEFIGLKMNMNCRIDSIIIL